MYIFMYICIHRNIVLCMNANERLICKCICAAVSNNKPNIKWYRYCVNKTVTVCKWTEWEPTEKEYAFGMPVHTNCEKLHVHNKPTNSKRTKHTKPMQWWSCNFSSIMISLHFIFLLICPHRPLFGAIIIVMISFTICSTISLHWCWYIYIISWND